MMRPGAAIHLSLPPDVSCGTRGFLKQILAASTPKRECVEAGDSGHVALAISLFSRNWNAKATYHFWYR